MSLTPAEKKVRKLARLPANCICPNCGTTKQFGFSTVCIKYHTFVCSHCKTSHQAISHRCKSLTMSAWTDAEVAELERKGNDYAKRTWLKNAPPIGSGGRPREGDDVNVFKRFVVDAYERKRYYGEDDEGGAGMAVATAVPLSGPPPSHFTGGPPARTAPRSISRPPISAAPVAAAPAPPPARAPVADLLDFSSMTPATPAPPPAAAAAAAVFEADFEAFGAPAALIPTAPDPSAPATVVHDPFAPVATVPAAPSAASSLGFSFISSSPAAAAPTPTISAPAPVSTIKKPVMSNQCMSEKSSFISAMNLPSGNQPSSQLFVGGMIPQQGFGGNNMNMMQRQQQQQQQQQQAFMMQQQQMRMMGMNGMSNPAMMGMGMQGGMNPMTMNGGFGNQQSMMMNGGGFGGGTNMMNGATPSNNKNGNLNSLDVLDWKK